MEYNMDLVPVIIIDSEDGSRYSLKSNLEDTNFIQVIGDFYNLVSGYNEIIHEKPLLAFIDVSENTELALEVIEKISIQHRTCIIIAYSYDNSPEIVIRTLKAGAREFFSKPIKNEDLEKVYLKIKNLIEAEHHSTENSKIFTIFSNKGGLGKTTIATNLAVSLADLTGARVALVDLNLQLGDITTFLDINPSFDISYVVNNLTRVDESFLLSTLEKYKDKSLYVLADSPYLEQAEEISSEQISTVLGVLKSVFSYIVVDTGANFDGKTLCALDMSDSILLVSTINIPSLKNTKSCIDLFSRLGYDKNKIKLLINRYLPDDENHLLTAQRFLQHDVFWKISNNYFTVMKAINQGIPISTVEPNSAINQDFLGLASLLSNIPISKDRKMHQNNGKRSANGLKVNNLQSFLEKFLKK